MTQTQEVASTGENSKTRGCRKHWSSPVCQSILWGSKARFPGMTGFAAFSAAAAETGQQRPHKAERALHERGACGARQIHAEANSAAQHRVRGDAEADRAAGEAPEYRQRAGDHLALGRAGRRLSSAVRPRPRDRIFRKRQGGQLPPRRSGRYFRRVRGDRRRKPLGLRRGGRAVHALMHECCELS